MYLEKVGSFQMVDATSRSFDLTRVRGNHEAKCSCIKNFNMGDEFTWMWSKVCAHNVEGILLVFVYPSHLILCLQLWWLGYLSHQLIYGFIQILKIHVISNVLRSENVLRCLQTSIPTWFVAIKIIRMITRPLD
jgi:hypothetical protein